MKKILALIVLSILIGACATASKEEFRQARIEVEAGNEEAGLARLEEELKKNPNDTELRNYYQRHKQVAVERYLALGDNARSAGAFERAEQAYSGGLFREGRSFQKAYLLDLLQEMLEAGASMHRENTAGGYMEIDTEQDLAMAKGWWDAWLADKNRGKQS